MSEPLTFGSLFAGIGGFDLGFERASMVCKWQVEIDPYCQKVLAKHWPNVRRHDDVRTFPPEPIDEWRVDVICGGDPCQANSAAGQSKKQSFGGDFIRVVDALRPRIVVRENPTKVRKDAPWPWFRFRSELESLGYAVMPFRLRACCFGAKHQRDRLFVLAELADSNRPSVEGRNYQRSSASESKDNFPALVDTHVWPNLPRRAGYDSRSGLSDYVARVTAVGNSVVPQVAEWIGKRIVEATT